MTAQKVGAQTFEPLEVTVEQIVEEAPGVKSFFLDYDKNRFQYKASQVVRLYVYTENNHQMFHAFSIASSPTENHLLFTTKIRPDSPYKQALDKLEPGDQLSLLGPVGRFILPESTSNDIVMLGGGIAVTPLRGMIRFATDKQLPHKITLLYSNITPEDIVYKKQWKELESQNPNLRVVNTITHPEESKENWTGRTGRIDEALISEYVKNPSHTLLYVCGTPSMITDTVHILRNFGIDTSKVLIEQFPGYN